MADCPQILSVDSDEDEEEIDPRVQIELDNLNGASEIINHLEILHAEATTKFRSMNDGAINELKRLRKTLGKSVDKARPYYEARKRARQVQLCTQEAARAYQRAMGLYEAAKETIALAEDRLTVKAHHEIDPAWQEMLNHAIIKVYDAEKTKSKTELEHRNLAVRLAASEREVSQLAQKLTTSINKARPYFDERSYLEESLEEQKQKITDLSSSIQSAKQNYRTSLNNLEKISEEIHKIRKQKRLISRLPPREPCVGAENDDILTEDQLDINLDTFDSLSVTSSQTGNSELVIDETETMQELRKTLERCHSKDPGSSHEGNYHGNDCNGEFSYDSNVDGCCVDDEDDKETEVINSEDLTHDQPDASIKGHSNGEFTLQCTSDAAVLPTDSTTFLPKSPTKKTPLSPSSVFSVENKFFAND